MAAEHRAADPSRATPIIVLLGIAGLLPGGWLLACHVCAARATPSELARGPKTSPQLVDRLVRVRFDDFWSSHVHLDMGHIYYTMYGPDTSAGPFYIRTGMGPETMPSGKPSWVYGTARADPNGQNPRFLVVTGVTQKLYAYRGLAVAAAAFAAAAFAVRLRQWAGVRRGLRRRNEAGA